MRTIWSKGLSLLLSAALVLGLGCGAAGAETYGNGAGGRVIDEKESQGTVAQANGQVTFTTADYGVVVTLTSASLGGDVPFTDPHDGETQMLHTILVELGCIGYSTTPDGRVFTDDKQVMETEEYSALGMLRCHYYNVQQDGTIQVEGINDNDLLGNSSARFGLGTDERYDYEYSVPMTLFYADDGCYWITTQEALDLYCQITGVEVQSGPTFTDVSPDAWYYTFVETAAEKGLFAGTGDGTFAPEASMTYAEFLTVLSQFSGETLTPVTGGAWYDTYVQWAQPLIPAGMQEHFNPTAPITRQDMAALFGNFLERYDHPGQPVNSQVPSFVDSGDVADYAADGVTAVYQMGLMSGADGNRFLPLATATRAQVAVTMVQMARVMGR